MPASPVLRTPLRPAPFNVAMKYLQTFAALPAMRRLLGMLVGVAEVVPELEY